MCVRVSGPHSLAVPAGSGGRLDRRAPCRPAQRLPMAITGQVSLSKASSEDEREGLSTFSTRYPELCVLFLCNALAECVTLHSRVNCTSWKRQFRLPLWSYIDARLHTRI